MSFTHSYPILLDLDLCLTIWSMYIYFNKKKTKTTLLKFIPNVWEMLHRLSNGSILTQICTYKQYSWEKNYFCNIFVNRGQSSKKCTYKEQFTNICKSMKNCFIWDIIMLEFQEISPYIILKTNFFIGTKLCEEHRHKKSHILSSFEIMLFHKQYKLKLMLAFGL